LELARCLLSFHSVAVVKEQGEQRKVATSSLAAASHRPLLFLMVAR